MDNWLTQNNLQEYQQQFKDYGDSLDDLRFASEQEMMGFVKDELKESKGGKQKRIIRCLKALQEKLNAAEVEKSAVEKIGYDYNQLIGVSSEEQIANVVAKMKQEQGKMNTSVVLMEKNYYNLDVVEAMKALTTCGPLIQLAYASCETFSCQPKVGLLMSKYGTMVKDTDLASGAFTTAALASIRLHKLALTVLPVKPEKALLFVSQCAEQAGLMAVQAGKLADRVQVLVDLSEGALEMAMSDKQMSQTKRENMKAMMAEAKAQRVELESKSEAMKKEMEQRQQDLRDAEQREKEANNKKFALQITKVVVGAMVPGAGLAMGMGGGGDNDEKKESTVDMLLQKKYELNQTMMVANAALAKTVQQLKGMADTKNDLNKALKSIEMAIQTLGKIKVIFDNTRIFWEGVKTNCEQIAAMQGEIEVHRNQSGGALTSVEMQMIRESVVESGLRWFVLGKACYFAKVTISEINKKCDDMLSNLPTESDAPMLVNDIAAQIQDLLTAEENAMNEEQKAIEAEAQLTQKE